MKNKIHKTSLIAKKVQFNRNEMQLLGIYVRNYKVLHNQCFSLNSNYTLELDENQSENSPRFVVKKRNEIDLFKEYKLNIKVICGKNGVGKTSLIELMMNANYSRERNIYFFIDEKSNIITATEKVSILFNDEWIECNPHYIDGFSVAIQGNAGFDYEQHEDGLTFKENFFDLYYNDLKSNNYKKSFYDFEKDGRLLTHFVIKYKNTYNTLFKDFFKDPYIIEANKLEKEKPLYGILLQSLSNNDRFISELKKQDAKGKLKGNIITFLSALLDNKNIKTEFDQLDKNLQQIISIRELSKFSLFPKLKTKKTYIYTERKYLLKQYETISQKLSKLFKEINDFFDKFQIGDFGWPFFISAFKSFKDSKPRYLSDLSDGEFKMLEIRWKAYVSLYQASEIQGYWVCFDEPEQFLHPEWARNLISTFINQINHIRNYIVKQKNENILKKRTISLILATHSPFLLSDLNVNNILMLDKDKRSHIKEIIPQKTFGGNIGSMFYDSFFLESTIGSFAEEKIKKAMQQLKKQKNPSTRAKYEQIIDLISDPIVRALVKESAEN